MNPYIRFESEEIPFPNTIVISLPFSDAASQTTRRATMEATIDFRNDLLSANLCTLSYAASELAQYIKKLNSNCAVSFDSSGTNINGFIIDISCGNANKSDCTYTIEPLQNGIRMYGNSRVGALYSVYTLLNAQGLRWYYPGPEGEIVPEGIRTFVTPKKKTVFSPVMKDGRGLDLFSPLKDSEQFLLWMARNRMNITLDHSYTAALGDKLGMTFRVGGHMFEPFLDPDLPLEDGRSIWESHPEWYGLPEDKVRKKEDVLKNQFCVSQKSLVDYLAKIIINRLHGEWNHIDRMDIWGFDNGFGSSCQCDACKNLGNDSDRAIYFLSELRKRIDKEKGLNPVTLVACSYEGTKTMDPPTRAIPDNLFANDCIVCYPIHRCYFHDFDDPDCTTNAYYQKEILPWLNQKPRLPMIIGEYYNVTKYEDLPLVFAKRIMHEIPMYVKWGFTSITYMHPPIYNWGMRAVNHMLFAELSWDAEADSKALYEEYFRCLYGKYSSRLRTIYELMEDSCAHIGNYRNWWFSVLESLLAWDGGIPEKELDLTDHFHNRKELIDTMASEYVIRKEALKQLEEIINEEKYTATVHSMTGVAATPDQLAKELAGNRLQNRLYELRRGLIYGVDELHLLHLVVKEYDLAARNINDSELWKEIEETYDKLAGYFYPQKYVSRKVESYCDDALTRSQLRVVVDRRRAWKCRNQK